MGERLVVLEPFALRQAKYGHCAAQQFCIIFALKIGAACDLCNLAKYLFFGVEWRFPRAAVNPICARGTLRCAQRESECRWLSVVSKALTAEIRERFAAANQPAAAVAVGST
jgi:hypothetical protein